MLGEALGPGKVIAKVSADIDFDKVVRTEEIFDPDSQVVRSEQNTTEQVTGAVPPGGVVGVQSLTPGTQTTQTTGPGSGARRNNEKQTLNYEINKVVKQIEETTGEIKKLFISVIIDGTLVGDPPQYQARSAEEMTKLLDAVKTAVGYDEQRGDQIKLENVQFDKSMELQQKTDMEQQANIDLAMTAAGWVFGAIIVWFVLFRILLPMMRWITTSVDMVEEVETGPTPEEAKKLVEEKRLAAKTQESIEMRKSVEEMVGSDPRYAASVLRKWMRERTGA